MIVQDLISLLLTMPRDAVVCIDVDDGVKSSYQDILRVRTVAPALGSPFVAIDADYHEVDSTK